jgi:hypothetical protein
VPSTVFRRLPLLPAAILGAIAGTCLPVAGTATADPVGDIGADERLVVRGMTQIEPERLRLAIVDDDVLAWLSRPHDSRDEFLEGVVGRATLALQRAGFPTPQVRAVVEPSAGVERLAVDVVEGERLTAGRVEVTGLPDETAARLVTFLSERQPPLDAVPRSVDRPDGSTDTIWVDAGDRPATFLDPEWTPGGPAACDPIAERSIRAAVARFLRDEGHLAIAPLVDRTASARHPRGVTSTVRAKWIDASGTHEAFDVSLRRADGVADLVVAVKDLPPKATLRGIELSADCTTRREDLLAFLGITVGAAATERDRIGWRDRLRMSGRFLRHEVELRADPADPAAVVARFDLEEYPRATPLREPLSRAEATMLRFREWMVGATRAGDLIVDVRRRGVETAPAGPAARESGSAAARLVVSPTDGLVLTAMPGADTACGLVASGTRVSLVSPGNAGRLDVPLPARTRVTATIALSIARDASSREEPPKCLHNLSFGCGLASGGEADDGGVQIEMRIEPVACLAMVHERDPAVSFEGDTLVIVARGVTSRVDAASGRPLSLAVDGYELAADAREEGLQAAVAALDGTAGPNRFRDAAPVTSAVEFLASDGVAEACGRLVAAAGMPLDEPPIAAIVPVAAAVRRCLAVCLADGVIAPCDAAVVAARSAGPPVTALEIPEEDAAGTPQAVKKAIVRKIASFAWECTEDHCGRDSWPASLARAAACGLVGDPAIFREMTDFMAQEDYGPLAHACAAVLSPVPPIARSLALRGQERLSTIAFHTDCRPLLQALDRYGIDDCCASVLRSIDDDAARDLGRSVCGDPEMLVPLVRALRSHAGPADAADVLQPALDAWWEQTLRGRVAAWLDALARPRTAASPAGDAAPVKK